MEAEIIEKTGAGYGERTPERLAPRNSYRKGPWDTRVGTLTLRTLSSGKETVFPDC